LGSSLSFRAISASIAAAASRAAASSDFRSFMYRSRSSFSYRSAVAWRTNGLYAVPIAISIAEFANGPCTSHSLGYSLGRRYSSDFVNCGFGGSASPSLTICMLYSRLARNARKCSAKSRCFDPAYTMPARVPMAVFGNPPCGGSLTP
jgi:hypothetical protein